MAPLRMLFVLLSLAPLSCAGTPTIAICINGQERGLLFKMVLRSFEEHVRKPLIQQGFGVDVFLSIVDAISPKTVIQEAYRAKSLNYIGKEQFETKCELPRELMQFVSIQDCYEQIESMEESGNFRYDWIYRQRADILYISDVPSVSSLSLDDAYVSHGGMTDIPRYQCMNDHIFLCPRQLCRPYFRLLELYTSKYSCSHEVSAPSVVPSGMDGPPISPFRLPYSDWISPQLIWHLRYNGSTCVEGQSDSECCGRLRELEWHYDLPWSSGNRESGSILAGCRDRVGKYRRLPCNQSSTCRSAHRQCSRLASEWKYRCHMYPPEPLCPWPWQLQP